MELYNSFTKKKEIVKELTKNKLLVYSCGPTVYNRAHIGNLRAYVFADTLNRSFRMQGFKVKHVINLTDVGHLTDDANLGEDKIEKASKKEGISAIKIVEKVIKFFYMDLEALNVPLNHYIFPKATEYISEQIDIIKDLEKKGLTYKTQDGMYFNVSKFKTYGVLGEIYKRSDSTSQSRITKTENKKSEFDFALWKFSPVDAKRQQEWDSPWGVGFPGWHIECSAMAISLLGNRIDIHTGGIDHLTLHHNNEIAQSESYTGKKFSNIWLHCGFLTLKNKKVSKSEGAVFALDDLTEKGFHPLSLRYLFLQNTFSTPLSFSFEALASSNKAFRKLNHIYASLPDSIFGSVDKAIKKKILNAVNKNLNTSQVLSILWETIDNKLIGAKTKKKTIKYIDSFLGLLTKLKEDTVPSEVLILVKNRELARRGKKYIEADKIREEIHKKGFIVDDLETDSIVYKKPEVFA